MTKNKARKAAARQIQADTGKPYSVARREATPDNNGVILCSRLAQDIHQELIKFGWGRPDDPFNVPNMDEMGAWEWLSGPAQISVTRPMRESIYLPDSDDPDDPEVYDLTQPPKTTVMFPIIESHNSTDDFTDHGFTAHAITGHNTPKQIAAHIRSAVTEGRKRGVATLTTDDSCTVCGDARAARHLVNIRHHRLCPFCLYDQDVMSTVHPAAFVLFYDYYVLQDSAFPTEWTPHAVLLSLLVERSELSPQDLIDDLSQDILQAPLEHWRNSNDLWVWLPTDDPRLPTTITDLHGGARLGALIDALDQHDPGLRERFTDAVLNDYAIEEPNTPDEEADIRNAITNYWPLLIAIACCSDLVHSLDGHGTGHWIEQIIDSPHPSRLFDYFGLDDDTRRPGLVVAVATTSTLTRMIAPEVVRG